MNPQQPPYSQQPPAQGGYYYQHPALGSAPPPGPGHPPAGGYQQPYGQQQQYPNQLPPGSATGAPPPPPPGQYQQPYGQQGQQYPSELPGQYQQPYGQPPQQYPNQPPPQHYGQPPLQGYPNQPPPQGYPSQPPPQQYPHPSPQQYPGQPPQGQYPQQQYGAPQWPQPYGQQSLAQPAPASPGYDQAQKAWIQSVNTITDVETLRNAMKRMGCDESALIRVFTDPKYSSPWAMEQLATDYNRRFMRDLLKDIKSETKGDFEDTLMALIQGPLQNDVYTLSSSMQGAGTDETALADVLLGRSNSDIRAISAEYRHVKQKDLLAHIKDEVSDSLFRMYSMALSATRAEPAAPVIAAEIDHKVTELHRATEGTFGANNIAVAEILVKSSAAQIHAINEAYNRKYHRSLKDVVEDEFRGDVEDAFLHLLGSGTDKARADAMWLKQPLEGKVGVKDKMLIYRVTTLYWDRSRLEAAKGAYRQLYNRTLGTDISGMLTGDYRELMLALVGEQRKKLF